MAQNFISGQALPIVSQELIEELLKIFPKPEVRPGFDRDAILWASAQHDVVQFIASKAGVTTVDPTRAQRAVVRMGT